MALTGLREIDLEVAHDLLNDIRAHSIVLRQSITLHGRQSAASNARRIGSYAGFVLNIPLRKHANRACAKTEQDFGLVIGVALKVSMQVAPPLRLGEGISLQAEVIEPNPVVSGVLQRRCDRFELPAAFKSAR